MYENMIIGTLIGAVGGICVARGWWLRRTRTRQQARCVVMEEVVLPEVTSWQVLSERLTLSMLTRAVPPMVRLQATQPFFLLDRRQVHRLRDVLSSADDHLRQLFIATNLPVDQTNDTTEGSLGKKVHFVKRPVSLQHPAILSLVDALTVELTQAELMIFMVRVFSLSSDIEHEDADGFYAEEPSGDGLRHLMPSHKPDRQGPALCGSLPKPERSVLGNWWFFPLQGEPETQHLCPTCWLVCRTRETSPQASQEAEVALPDDPSSQDLARYDV